MKTKNPDAVKLGKHLRKLREQYDNGIYKRRTNFAKLLKEKSQNIYDYEVGRKFPTFDILIDLYKHLKVSFEELLEPLFDIDKPNIETQKIISKVKRICAIDEYREALGILLEGYVLPPVEKKLELPRREGRAAEGK